MNVLLKQMNATNVGMHLRYGVIFLKMDSSWSHTLTYRIWKQWPLNSAYNLFFRRTLYQGILTTQARVLCRCIGTFLKLIKWWLWLFMLRDGYVCLSVCLFVQVFTKSGAEQQLIRRALYLKQSIEAALQKHEELHIDYKSRVRKVVSSKVFDILRTTSSPTQNYCTWVHI